VPHVIKFTLNLESCICNKEEDIYSGTSRIMLDWQPAFSAYSNIYLNRDYADSFEFSEANKVP